MANTFMLANVLLVLVIGLSLPQSQGAGLLDGLGGGFGLDSITGLIGGGNLLEKSCRKMARSGKTQQSTSSNSGGGAAAGILSAVTGGRRRKRADILSGIQGLSLLKSFSGAGGIIPQGNDGNKLIDNDCLSSNANGIGGIVNQCVNFWVDEKIKQCEEEKVFQIGNVFDIFSGNSQKAILDLCTALVKKTKCNKLKNSRDDEKCVFCDVVKLATVDDKKLQDCVCKGGLGAFVPSTNAGVSTRLQDCIGGEVAKGVINTKVTGLVGC